MSVGGYGSIASSESFLARYAPRGRCGSRADATGHVLILAVLVVVSLALRWPNLWTIPLWTDESDEAIVALRLVRDGVLPLTNDNAYNGPLYNYLVAGAFGLLGANPWIPRLVALVVGAATIVPTYLLGRELVLAAPSASPHGFLRRAGAGIAGGIAGGLLAVNAAHIVVNSHVGWGHALTPFFTTTAVWLLRRAIRLHVEATDAVSRAAPSNRAEVGATVRAAGPPLVLSGLVWGLALQTHPTVAVMLPVAALFVVWKGWRMLVTPWPYLAGVAFAVGQVSTIVHAIRSQSLVLVDAGLAQRAIYDGNQIDTLPGYLVSLGGLTESIGASLAGLVNDRVTPMAPIWHPLLVLGLLVSLLTLTALWRSGRPLPALLVLSVIFGLPYLHGQFDPIITRSRYAAPLVPLLLAVWSAVVVETWAAHAQRIAAACEGRSPSPSRTRGLGLASPFHRRSLAALVLIGPLLVLALGSLVSLAAFSDAAVRDGRTNAQLIESYSRLMTTRQPDEPVAVDRGMLRDWTLTQGRLGRIVAQWLEMDAVSVVPIEVLPDGRFSGGLQESGGLAVLARGSLHRAVEAYDLEEIASGAAPGASPDRGYTIVRATRRP